MLQDRRLDRRQVRDRFDHGQPVPLVQRELRGAEVGLRPGQTFDRRSGVRIRRARRHVSQQSCQLVDRAGLRLPGDHCWRHRLR